MINLTHQAQLQVNAQTPKPTEQAVAICHSLAQGSTFKRDTSELMRMDSPEKPAPGCFYKLTRDVELDQEDQEHQEHQNRWRTILHGIAVMTPRNPIRNPMAHNGLMPVGRALYLGYEEYREAPLYSETRLNQLLIATGPSLRSKINHTCRVMAQNHIQFNWREMASLILSDGADQETSEKVRRKIARDYYQASRRQPKPQAEKSTEG